MDKNVKPLREATDPKRWAQEERITDELRQRIEVRAYEIYEARGAEPGRDVDDWLQAETEILKPRKVQQAA